MSNYETARLVRSVVADRDLVPVMTHFHLYGGRIQGTNGKMTLDAPWDLNDEHEMNVPADPFVKAFETMDDPKFSFTEANLTISEGKMRVRMPISKDPFPRADKPAEFIDLPGDFLAACRKVRPFISADASRPWACGVLVSGGYIYATNNVVLVRTPWAWGGEDFSLPSFAIDQLIRCNRTISGIAVTENEIGFDLGDSVWMATVRYEEQWPDVDRMIVAHEELPLIDDDLKSAVEKVLPFVPDKRHPVIRFVGDRVATQEGEMEAEIETSCGHANFHAVPLLEVLKYATRMDTSFYPKPVPFSGFHIEGVVVGVRV